MRKYRTVKFVAVLIFLAALFFCLVSLVAAVWMARGLPGGGWGPGWRGWVLIPVLVSGCFGAVSLLVFGAILFFLTKVENNLDQAARGRPVAAPGPVVAQPPAVEPIVEPISVPPPVEIPPASVEPIAVAETPGLAVAAEERPVEWAEPAIGIEPAPPPVLAAEPPAPVTTEATVELESGIQVSPPALLAEPPPVIPDAVEVELAQPAVEVAPLVVETPAVEIEAGVQGPQIEVEPLAVAATAPQAEFHFPSVEIFESEPEVALPQLEIAAPKLEVAKGAAALGVGALAAGAIRAVVEAPQVETPQVEVALPAVEIERVLAIEIAAPKLEAALPAVEIERVPAIEIAAPQLEAVLPAVEIERVPAIEIAAPKLEAALPEVEIERVPAIEIAAPKLEAVLPAVEIERVPAIEIAAPKLEAALPAVEIERVPAIEIAAPKLETRRVPAIESAPDEVMSLRAQLAALQARLAELEAQPAAVGVVPVAPEKLAAELPVKLPALPDAARQPLATTGRLPGVEEAARIAAEMAALKPAARHDATSPTVPPSTVLLATETTQRAASAPTDDLLIIKGIGPTYVQRLTEVGITTFAALAAASDALLDQITIGLPGRAVREDWRGQARQLAG